MATRQQRLDSLFKSEHNLQVVAGHNVHESFNFDQQGRVMLISFEQLSTFVTETTTEEFGLGRQQEITSFHILTFGLQMGNTLFCTQMSMNLLGKGRLARKYQSLVFVSASPELIIINLKHIYGSWALVKEK
eukprot:15344846-Ditylum_brightwellii.AAC.1